MRVALVHGFNVRDPAKTIGRLEPVFEREGVQAHLFRYGWLGLLGVRTFSDNLAEAFRCFCQGLADDGEPVVVVAHSHGCALTHRTSWLMDEFGDDPPAFSRAVYLSPALNRNVVFAPVPLLQRVDVFHTRNDMAVRASRLLVGHEWGDMGAVGYRGDDARVHNVDGTACIDGHSSWFTDAGLEFLRQRLVLPLVREYGRT